MKKILKKAALFAVALTASATAFAQPAAGTFSLTPKIGLNVAGVTSKYFDASYTLSDGRTLKATADYKADFVGGVELGYQVTDKFALSAGVLYSGQGFDRCSGIERNDDDYTYSYEDDSSLKLGYINIPILANYYIFKGFAVKAGIQPGFLVSAKYKKDINASGMALGLAVHEDMDAKDYCNTIDLSIPVGVSYELGCGVIFDLRYNIGLTHVAKETEYTKDPKGNNSVFQLTVGYKIGL
jgi:hypothetical protein